MHSDSKKYTAFSTFDGHFHDRMPFGLKNAPATFQRMIDQALTRFIEKHCFVYLDNVIIFRSTIQEHNRNLAIPTHERNRTKTTTKQVQISQS